MEHNWFFFVRTCHVFLVAEVVLGAGIEDRSSPGGKDLPLPQSLPESVLQQISLCLSGKSVLIAHLSRRNKLGVSRSRKRNTKQNNLIKEEDPGVGEPAKGHFPM